MELVPFQTKKKKVFKHEITTEEAIKTELLSYWKKQYPKMLSHLKDNPHLLDTLTDSLVPVLAPQYITDTTLPWTIARVSNPLEALLTLEEIAKGANETFPKRRITILPKTHQKLLKRVYTSHLILDSLSKTIASNKKAAKTLRILHKRLGIYTKKKPPFKPGLHID